MNRKRVQRGIGQACVKFVVIFVGIAILFHVELWGADWKVYGTTGTGYIFHPKHSNGRALVYCHGGFGIRNPEGPPVDYFVSHGWTVLIPKYGEEIGKPMSIQEDIQVTLESIQWLREKFGSIDLIGVSRGGFVALQAFVRYGEEIQKCVAVVAPARIQSWEQMGKILVEQQQYFKGLEDPYGYIEKMPLTERLELGKRLLLIYGNKDDIVPASQGRELSEKLSCKLILVDEGHTLFHKRENEKLAEAFLLGSLGAKLKN